MKLIWYFIAILTIFISLIVGKVELSLSNILDPDSLDFQILTQIRIPRTIMAFIAGAVLALSGLLFQTLFRNPLTTPFTLGISSGATLGAATAIIFGFTGSFLGFSAITLFGFLGAVSTIFFIYIFAQQLPSSKDYRLILVGIALSFLYSSLLLGIYYISNFQESYLILRFTMGSLLSVGYVDIIPLFISMILTLFVALKYREELKLLSISDEFAFLKGVDVNKLLITIFATISLSIGILISIVGPIGFIGLIVPHVIKIVTKNSIEKIIMPTFIAGGLFLVMCDTLARALPTASEIPVGIITSLIGGLIFIYILVKAP